MFKLKVDIFFGLIMDFAPTSIKDTGDSLIK